MVQKGNIKFYKDADGAWRWRIVANNRKIVAVSSEGYKNRVNAEGGARYAARALGVLLPEVPAIVQTVKVPVDASPWRRRAEGGLAVAVAVAIAFVVG